jgi:hypothetical protein
VASFRVLKSNVVEDGKLTKISELHAGARLNGDLEFRNHHLALELASHQENTDSAFQPDPTWIVKCHNENVDVREFKHCIINGVSAPYGDFFLGLDVPNTPLGISEVGQCKSYKTRLTEESYMDERGKCASKNDFFITYTTQRNCNFRLPENSGIVDGNNWKPYFGPFAGRAHIYAATGPVDLNNATRQELETVEGMGPKRVDKVIHERGKRKFDSYADVEERTKIPLIIVRRFKNPAL